MSWEIKQNITPMVIDRIITWSKRLSEDKSFRWTKTDAKICMRLIQEKKDLLSKHNKKYRNGVE